MGVVESILALAVAAFGLAVMFGGVWVYTGDSIYAGCQARQRLFQTGFATPTVGEFKTIVIPW